MCAFRDIVKRKDNPQNSRQYLQILINHIIDLYPGKVFIFRIYKEFLQWDNIKTNNLIKN